MKKILIALLLAASPVFATVGDTSLGRVTLPGNGSQTVFTFTYPVAKITDIVTTVTVSGSPVTITNFVTLNADQISHPGGTVTFTSPPANGASVKIERDMQLTQTTSLSPFFPFPAKTVELTFDRASLLIQQVQRNLNDAVIAAGGGGSSFSLTMPGDFTVAGSPGTSITVSRNSQNQHYFLGAPYTGNGTPVYRLIDVSDLPASGASAATYGDATHIPIFTLTLTGTISAASTSSTALAGLALVNPFTNYNTFIPSTNGGNGQAVNVTAPAGTVTFAADNGVKGTGGAAGTNATHPGGSGIVGQGGAGSAVQPAGPGATFTGGATAGAGGAAGVVATGTNAAAGGSFTGGSNQGPGLVGQGGTNGIGVQGTGGTGVLGVGGSFTGSATAPEGLIGTAGAGSGGIGVKGAGDGSGAGGAFTGGASSGTGVTGLGGGPGGNGGSFTGVGTATGAIGIGGGSGGSGVNGYGTGSAPGVEGIGAGTGPGVTGNCVAPGCIGGQFIGGSSTGALPGGQGISGQGGNSVDGTAGTGLYGQGGNASGTGFGGYGVEGHGGTGGHNNAGVYGQGSSGSTGGEFKAGASSSALLLDPDSNTPAHGHIAFSSTTAFPSAPAEGELYYSTVKHVLCTYNGSRWICPISGVATLAGGVQTVAMPITGMNCSCTEATTAANVWKCAVSGTTLTLNGTGTDNIGYTCN